MAKTKKKQISEEEELEQAFRDITGYDPSKKKKRRFPLLLFILALLVLAAFAYRFSL